MKKSLLFISIILFTLTSCEDFLTVTPQTSKGAEDYYTSEALRANTASLYGYPWFGFHAQLMWEYAAFGIGQWYFTECD